MLTRAALRRLLEKVRDLGMPLVSVKRVQFSEAHQNRSKKEKNMNTINKITEKEEVNIPVKMKLSALWASLMFLYIYADHFSLFRPGQIGEMMAGRMGPFPVTQGSLLAASLLMLISAVMIFLSLALRPKVSRWANIILGILYTCVNISNLIGETWAYYIFTGIVEIVLTLLIAWYAWRWRNPEAKPE